VQFVIFFLVFLSLYGGMHVYGFLKIRQALVLSQRMTVALVVFMALMVIAPVVIRTLERHGFESVARFLAYIGYTWMGLLFLFFSLAVVLDIFRLIVHAGGVILHSDLSGLTLSPRHSVIAALIFAVSMTGFGAFDAVRIRTERVVIESRKIPETVGRLRIVQISDVHLGIMVGEKRLRWILDRVKMAGPDILVSTGDLVDGQADGISNLAGMFSAINPKYGKFAVTGNHEFYAGLPHALAFTEKAGFTVLRGEGKTVSGLLNIAGVDDPAGDRYGVMKHVSEKALLSNLPREKFTLLLKHRPLIDRTASNLFDLQLSGHTHNGQIFPFNLVTRLFYPLCSGRYELGENSRLYVSRGSGTWGPPVRFLSPPEVTVIDLVHK
jgi:predicted MPP superfamily phosphohydrolase